MGQKRSARVIQREYLDFLRIEMQQMDNALPSTKMEH